MATISRKTGYKIYERYKTVDNLSNLQKCDIIFQEFSKQALKHSLPIYLENHKREPIELYNGTISFIDAGEQVTGVTCQHIIKNYEDKKSQDGDWRLRIGNSYIELSALKDQNERLDLATLIFSKSDFNRIKLLPSNQGFGSQLIMNIYRDDIKPEELIIIGGFPGDWRKKTRIMYPPFLVLSNHAK